MTVSGDLQRWNKSTPIPLDKDIGPGCFTIFRVHVHPEDEEIAEGCENARLMFERQSQSHFTVPRIHSFGQFGNFFSLCFPAGDTQRVKIITEVLETLWIYDDVIEQMTHGEAQETHSAVSNALDVDHARRVGSQGTDAKTLMARLFEDFGPRMQALDPQGAPAAIRGIKHYLETYDDTKREDIYNVRDYLDYRERNAGHTIMESSMIWVLDLRVDWRETELSRAYYHAAGKALALGNDFYSWTIEKSEAVASDGRRWNLLPIVMHEYNLDEETAKLLVKGMLVDAEQKVRRLGQQLRMVSGAWDDYTRGMTSYLAGNAFWSATCPRYHPQAGKSPGVIVGDLRYQ